MIKKITTLLAVIISLLLCFTCGGKEPDFRTVRWGMTPEEVMEADPGEYDIDSLEKKGIIYRDMKLDDAPVSLFYTFKNHQLVKTEYIIGAGITDHCGQSPDAWFNKYQPQLEKKYGKPDVKEEKWSSEEAKATKPRNIWTVASGDLTMTAKWKTDRTAIEHILRRSPYSDYSTEEHIITYTSMEFLKAKKKRSEGEKITPADL